MPRSIAASAGRSPSPSLHIAKRRSASTRASSQSFGPRRLSDREFRRHLKSSTYVQSPDSGLLSPPASDSDDLEEPGYDGRGTFHEHLRNSQARVSSVASKLQSPPQSESEDSYTLVKNDENARCQGTLYRRRSLRFAFRDGPADSFEPSSRLPDVNTSASGSTDPFPFPLQPLTAIVATHFPTSNTESRKKIKRRCASAGTPHLTPPVTPDRFISNRGASQDATENFRVSKRTSELSKSEKLLRHHSASPDPFESPTNAQVARRIISSNQGRNNNLMNLRTVSGTNLLSPFRGATNVQERQVSTGAVWNVGGSSATTPSGPINSVPDGRGGFVGSGTNAPMYTSRFFQRDTPEMDRGRLERRLAAALDIDQVSRVLRHSRSPQRDESKVPNAKDSSPRSPRLQPYTIWENGQWVRQRSLSRKQAFFVFTGCMKPAIPFFPWTSHSSGLLRYCHIMVLITQ